MSAPGATGPRAVHPLQWVSLVLVLSLGAGAAASHWRAHGHLEQTEPLFVGFPTLMAAALVMVRPERTLKGLFFQGLTVAVIVAGMVIGDGYSWLLSFPFAFFYFSLVAKPEPAAAPAASPEAGGPTP